MSAGRLVLASLIVLLAGSFPSAHHSILGQFDISKAVMLTGTIAKVDWINPHPYVYLDVKDARGNVTRWGLSMVPLAMLRKIGVTNAKLAGIPGEVVKITVYPALNGQKLGWITRITYADGRYYALGTG